MGKINVLPFAVANLIAAGEVVDRPASVIKELMENAMDAGATRIAVEIQHGGISFMRVTDNGCGMTEEDLVLSIRRHATSKIKDARDLEAIMTLGFRGEALAATASVSHMRIISRTSEDTIGHVLETTGGEDADLYETGCPIGTTVIVEDLFCNVPARRKFLKKDLTEAMAVCSTVEHMALSRPDVAVTLISDGQRKLETAGDGNLKNAVYAVYGRDFASRLIEVDGNVSGIGVKGFIGRSDNVRGNRNCQDFFINGRLVKSKTATAALEQAYVSYLPPEKFPCCVLQLSINPATIDVNVHPAKLEVHFSNEKVVFEAIYYTVKAGLEQNKTRPDVTFGAGKTGTQHISPEEWRQSVTDTTPGKNIANTAYRDYRGTGTGAFMPIPTERNETKQMTLGQTAESIQPTATPTNVAEITEISKTQTNQTIQNTQNLQDIREENHSSVNETVSVSVEAEAVPTTSVPEEDVPTYRLVGQVFNSYLIVETGDKMLLVDQHAAHERILFEKLKAGLHQRQPESQFLMIPVEVPMTEEEMKALEQYAEDLRHIGFEWSVARNCLLVSAIPSDLELSQVACLLETMASQIREGTGNVTLTHDILLEKALYQASCKAAIKAGREYAEGHLQWVVDQLMKIPDITFCPHGRPVAMELTKKMLDKQFERIK